jgi:MoxR-like ATPase
VSEPGADTLPIDDTHASARKVRKVSYLVVAFACDRPLSIPSRHALTDVDVVTIGRADARGVERRTEKRTRHLFVRVEDARTSSAHAELVVAMGKWCVRDLGSTNGTRVNGVVQRSAELVDGDLIETGHMLFLFREIDVPDDADAALDVDAAPLDPALPGPAPPLTRTTLSPAFDRELAVVEKLAPTLASILLFGESGTGKEVVARAIHARSGRTGAFVAVNCGAIPGQLVESELFGYRKGAFSGAVEDRPGIFRTASQGTLFLDEIGDLPLPAQAAFLRALQEREVVPVGGGRPVAIDLRVVAASHRSLERLVQAKQFRADLFARLAGYVVVLPPLRERREDIGLLTAALIRRLAPARADRVRFAPSAARALFLHRWPLNVRELEKCLEIALVLAGDGPVETAHLSEPARAARTTESPPALSEDEAARRAELVALLDEHGGNVSAVARAMGKARMQIQRWMKAYRIEPRDPGKG